MALKLLSSLFGGTKNTPEIHLFNTLTKKRELFLPLSPKTVKMYHCGPTVYGYQHIGNYRAYIFADTLKRFFLSEGYRVKQVINITDVGHLTSDEDEGEDKMEIGARREGKTAADIAKVYTDDFMENLALLHVNTSGTEFPKATEHILEQIAMIQTLLEKGYTYQTSDGIYFDTSRARNYGKLGNINIQQLKEGARVKTNAEKRNPTDFALWKFSPKQGEKRQQEWESPWGVGFPGWHIECSAMSAKYLGKQFDIHTGGIDHIPVHHQNEIAQSEAAFGKPFVRYWLHVEHLRVDGKKISKSLGNTILIKNITDKGIPPLAFRYWLLTSHYKTPVNFTWEALESSHSAYEKLKRFFVEDLPKKVGIINKSYRARIHDAIADDFNTPKAIGILHELIKDNAVHPEDKKATILYADSLLGIGFDTLQNKLMEMDTPSIPDDVTKLVAERERARIEKNWTAADALREKIGTLGYEVKDTDTGPVLRKKTTL